MSPKSNSNQCSEASNRPQSSVKSQCKSFQCSHPGCDRSFSRAEHLQRHALNHSPGGLVCAICSANFKRADLLKRHMDRHRQKDLEAGGPGCGSLDTRKRSWRAADGSIVSKRPCLKPAGRSGNQSRNQSQNQSQAQQQPSPESADEHINNALLLSRNISQNYQSIDGVNSIPYELGDQPPATQIEERSSAEESFGSAFASDSISPFLEFPDFVQPADQLDYEQIFNADTASSFNMPFTTAIDYNWLLQVNPTLPDTNINRHGGMNSQHERTAGFLPPAPDHSPESMTSSHIWSESTDSNSQQRDMYSLGLNHGRSNGSLPLAQRSQQTEYMTSAHGNGYSRTESMRSHINQVQHREPISHRTGLPPEQEQPFSTIRRDIVLPRLDEHVHEKLLAAIQAASPCLPDQHASVRTEPLLSITRLQNYLELFFSRFNTVYPLIHLPTFQPAQTEPLLLLSLLLLGATYSSEEAHRVATSIHDVIRPSIFAHAGFSHQPQLWTLQTILLVECFGKSRAGQKQHDMSHLFHGLLINLIRRSDCQNVKPAGPPINSTTGPDKSLQKAWNDWALAEQKKRLALLCFMWDTQHAVLFCQSLCMSAFELRVEMPCSQNVWEAADAASWQSSWQSTSSASHSIPFLVALKSYLTPSVPRPVGLSWLSRILILHGIMATFWDMQRRDQSSLGVLTSGKSASSWRKLIGEAYDSWETDFRAYCAAFAGYNNEGGGLGQNEASSQEFAFFVAAYSALYHAVQIILNADLLDIQIYAGSRHILGRPVRQRDYIRSAEVVQRWVASNQVNDGKSPNSAIQPKAYVKNTSDGQSARVAAWHAARLLHEDMKTLADFDAIALFHVPWCLYIATLSCWAYHHARPSQLEPHQDGNDQDEIVWDPRGEMQILVADMAERSVDDQHRKRRTNGLVWTMAETLTKVRWGIVQAGVLVLKGLVPGRLIHYHEESAEM